MQLKLEHVAEHFVSDKHQPVATFSTKLEENPGNNFAMRSIVQEGRKGNNKSRPSVASVE